MPRPSHSALDPLGPVADARLRGQLAQARELPGHAVLCLGEHYDAALRLLDFASERARREGHAARQGIIHGQRALIELDRGSLRDAQVEAETGLLLVDERHFVVLQLLAVAIIGKGR